MILKTYLNKSFILKVSKTEFWYFQLFYYQCKLSYSNSFIDFMRIIKVIVYITSQISFQEEQRLKLNVTGSSLEEAVPNLRDRNSLYSSWSTWSRCNRKCKQIRTRHCRNPSECGTNLLREERACFKDKCRNRDQQVFLITIFY